ncbi:hypothetical protein [Pectinatus haikarae]|uniref:hypothetical protein n=1 Tax=Pectinatus haikarae TaxID=349096 RepID=UPI0018C5F3C2|nr:hypothetical protein [Pectinatus haikarae]
MKDSIKYPCDVSKDELKRIAEMSEYEKEIYRLEQLLMAARTHVHPNTYHGQIIDPYHVEELIKN